MKALLIIACTLLLLLLICFIIRPKKYPLPPLEIMEERERHFDEWLMVLYRDNLSLKTKFYTQYPQECPNERMGQYDADWALFHASEAFEPAYVNIFYWDTSWKVEDWTIAELEQNIAPMLQRFDVQLNWQTFDEQKWTHPKDDVLLYPIMRWLYHEFARQNVFLYLQDIDSEMSLAVAVPMTDKVDFLMVSKKWGLTECDYS